jgi:hypothetical protein
VAIRENSAEREMNIRKGLFRLVVVLSILVGAITPLCHKWFFDEMEVNISLPENWKGMSIQERLYSLDGLLSRDATVPLVTKIKQLNIRRQLRKMIVNKADEVLKDGFGYSFGFHFYVGWVELSLLGLVGFASVWTIYGFVRVVPSLIPYVPIIHFPTSPLNRRVESLKFPVLYEPQYLDSRARITLFAFLALEEGPKRPSKPAALWID